MIRWATTFAEDGKYFYRDSSRTRDREWLAAVISEYKLEQLKGIMIERLARRHATARL